MEKLFAQQQPLTPHLAHLMRQAEAQNALLYKLNQHLPNFLRDAMISCMIQDHRLIITVANSALLNRLRLHQYQLLQIAQQEFSELTEIYYQLTAESSYPPHSTRAKEKPRVDASAIAALTQLSEQITDSALSASLQTLATVLARKS